MKFPGLKGVAPLVVVKRLVHEVNQNDTLGNAAQLAYYFLLALFPLLIFLASLLGYLPIPDLFGQLISSLSRVMPPEAVKLVADTLAPVITDQHGGLLSFGILTAIWAASVGVSAIIGLLNQIYRVSESRAYWKVKLISIGLTMMMAVLVLLGSTLVFFGNFIGSWIGDHFGFTGTINFLWNLGKWVVALGSLFLALELIYYFGPDVKQEWKWITPGAALAVVVWLIASLGLTFYVQKFAHYNATYGSLGGVIVLMLWFYLSGLMILVGGQLNAIIEHQAVEGKVPGQRDAREPVTERRKGDRRRTGFNEQPHPA